MAFGRVGFSADGRLPQPLKVGDGIVANVAVHSKTDDAAATITTTQLAGGFIQQSGTLTAGRTITTPTGTLLDAAFPTMDVGDSFCFVVSNANAGAQNLTVAGGTGVTLTGSGVIPQYGSRMFALVKTGTATYSLY